MMNVEVHKSIVATIKQHRELPQDCLKSLLKSFPDIKNDTLHSIFTIEYQRRMKSNYSRNPTIINKYWEMYQNALQAHEPPGIIVRLSVQLDLTPCLLGKLILLKCLENSSEEDSYQVNNYLRDTALIPDKQLAYEIFLCTIYDNLYSPLCEAVKHSLGQQYEIRLHNEAVKLGLAFRTEDHLRKYGYDKTPDIKLEVPVAIDGFVINWIESKALFADEHTHKEYVTNQYLSYWNRFGPGLVIYWFGYVSTLVDEKRFIIRDYLPEDMIQPSTIKPRN